MNDLTIVNVVGCQPTLLTNKKEIKDLYRSVRERESCQEAWSRA